MLSGSFRYFSTSWKNSAPWFFASMAFSDYIFIEFSVSEYGKNRGSVIKCEYILFAVSCENFLFSLKSWHTLVHVYLFFLLVTRVQLKDTFSRLKQYSYPCLLSDKSPWYVQPGKKINMKDRDHTVNEMFRNSKHLGNWGPIYSEAVWDPLSR